MRKKRLLIALGITLAVLATVYLARRLLFESLIIGKTTSELSALLGADVRVGAVRGNWFTAVRLEDVSILGGKGSAYGEIRGVDVDVEYSPIALIRGDLRGLHSLRITADRVTLDTEGDWVPPEPAATAAVAEAPSPTWFAELLDTLPGGATLVVDRLELQPGYLAPGRAELVLSPGRGHRDARLTAPAAKITGTIDPTGSYQVSASGDQAGRIVRGLGVPDTVDQGALTSSFEGNIETGSWESHLRLDTELANGQPIHAGYDLALRDGRIRAPQVLLEVPGVSVTGSNLDLPTESWDLEALVTALDQQTESSFRLRITDLERYRARLPAAVLPHLPITGEVAATIRRRAIEIAPSTLEGKDFILRLAGGSITLPPRPAGTAPTLGHLRTARAENLKFEFRSDPGIEIDTPQGKIHLAGRLDGSFAGQLDTPDARASFALRSLRFGPHRAEEFTGTLTFDGSRFSLTEAHLRGVTAEVEERTTSPLELHGKVTYVLGADDGPARVACELTTVGTPWLQSFWVSGRPAIADRTAIPDLRVVADLRLPSGDALLPTGTVAVDLAGVRVADLAPLTVSGRATLDGDGLRLDPLTAKGELGELTVEGTVDLRRQQFDLSAHGALLALQPITATLEQPPLSGSLELGRLELAGPWHRPTTLALRASAKVTSIDPTWYPVEYRAELPTAPLDLAVTATGRDANFDLENLVLQWGAADRRLTVRAKGPVPLALIDGALAAADRDAPLQVEIDAAAARPHRRVPVGSVTFETALEIRSTGVILPKVVARSPDITFQATALRVDAPLAAVLDGSLDWGKVPVGGSVELREFGIGSVLTKLLGQDPKAPQITIDGSASGQLTVAGSLFRPQLDGEITLERGSVTYPGAPAIRDIGGTARFDANRAVLQYAARTEDDRDVRVRAELATEGTPLAQAFVAGDTPLRGNLEILGLDLALLRRSLPDFPGLHGEVRIAGKLGGTTADPIPELAIEILAAGWVLRDSKEEIRDVTLAATLTRSRVELSRCTGVVPTIDLSLQAKGHVQVEGGALWEIASERKPKLEGALTFADIPLGLLPRGNGIDAAQGVLAGNLEVTGTLDDLRPKLSARLVNAAIKATAVPRIEALNATLSMDSTGLALEGKANMGAGPVVLTAKIQPGSGDFLQSYREGTLDARLRGQRVLLVRNRGLKIRSNLDLHAAGPLHDVEVTGTVKLDKSKYVKRLTLVPDLKISGGAAAGHPFGPWVVPGGANLRFDVQITTIEPIVVRANVVDTEADVNCRLQGQGDSLHLVGACSSRSGTIRFPGMGMQVSSLRLVFNKAQPTRPRIIAAASGQRHGIRIDLRARGFWDDPIITLSSVPALQPRDLWTLVTTGVRPQTLASNSAKSNTAILATYVVQELLLTYFASESTEASESFVSRFTFEFGRELSKNGAETWEVNFDIGDLWLTPPRFGLRFERDVYEDYNLGLVYRWRF